MSSPRMQEIIPSYLMVTLFPFQPNLTSWVRKIIRNKFCFLSGSFQPWPWALYFFFDRDQDWVCSSSGYVSHIMDFRLWIYFPCRVILLLEFCLLLSSRTSQNPLGHHRQHGQQKHHYRRCGKQAPFWCWHHRRSRPHCLLEKRRYGAEPLPNCYPSSKLIQTKWSIWADDTNVCLKSDLVRLIFSSWKMYSPTHSYCKTYLLERNVTYPMYRLFKNVTCMCVWCRRSVSLRGA